MEYLLFTIVIVVVLTGASLWFILGADKKDKPFKQTKRNTILVWVITLLVGFCGYFVQRSPLVSAMNFGIISAIIFITIGIFSTRFLRKKDQLNLRKGLPYLFFLLSTSCAIFFLAFWFLETPFFASQSGLANNLALSTVFGFVPFSVYMAYHYWLEIPIVKQELIPWEFPTNIPRILENGSCPINFYVRAKQQETNPQIIPIRIIPTYTLGEVFHRAVYEYNVIKKSPRPIEIAENNRKENIYSWHFFLQRNNQPIKKYIDPDATLEQLGLKRGGTIYAERSK